MISKEEIMAVMKAHQGMLISYVNETTDDGQILSRAIYPLVLGTTKKGKLAVRGYQYFGASHTAPLGWRIFLLKNIKNWTLKGELPVNPPTGYNQNGDDDLNVIYQIKYPLTETVGDAKAGEKSGDVVDNTSILYPLLSWWKRWRNKNKGGK